MKCPRCLSVCMPSDTVCFSCRQPFAAAGLPGSEGGKMPYAARVSAIFTCIGACLGPVVGKAFFPDSASSVMFAGIGAAFGGTLGYALGMLLFGPKGQAEEPG